MKERKKAKEVLALICDEIDKLGHPDERRRLYTGPIHEAARQNLYEVVHEILTRSPTAMQFKDESGYDIIQLAVIYRSERIYNFIYSIGEREGIYRTIEDSFRNNMLHLVGNLPPSQKLRRRSGPALQLQRELQWRQVYPKCITIILIVGDQCIYSLNKQSNLFVGSGEARCSSMHYSKERFYGDTRYGVQKGAR